MPRAVTAALGGDFAAAAFYQQVAWLQGQFAGAFRVPTSWWCRFFGVGVKQARGTLRRLEQRGWLTITRQGVDPTWWIEVHEDVAAKEIRAAEDGLRRVLMWELAGVAHKPSEDPGCPEGMGVCPEGMGVVPSGDPPPVCDETSKHQRAQGGKVEHNHPQPTHSTQAGTSPRPHAERSPSDGTLQGHQVAQRLREAYPHPFNGRAAATVPSQQQVESWLLQLPGRAKVPIRLDQPTLGAILAGCEQAAGLAKRAPEAYRRSLRTWLFELGWQEEVAQAPSTAPPGQGGGQQRADLVRLSGVAYDKAMWRKDFRAAGREIPDELLDGNEVYDGQIMGVDAPWQ